MTAIVLALLLLRPPLPGADPCRPWPACERSPELVVGAPRFGESSPLRAVALGPADTVQAPFEYSDGYGTRLTIHRIASWLTLPLFAAQWVTGEVLLSDRSNPPEWARALHGPLAAGVAGLFVVNTVTGGWNALEMRRDPAASPRAYVHTLLMLLADAGFVFTGLTAESAGTVGPHGRIRTRHRRAALISMGIATTGYLIMIPPFRRD